jgi:phage FluMu protein Com
MNKTGITIFIVLTIGILLGIIVLESNRTKGVAKALEGVLSSKDPIYFYGNTCPKCKDLQDFIDSNKIEEKVTIIKKEVYSNQSNALMLTKVAEKCNIPSSGIGVPFVYFEGKCLVGEPDIKVFLSKKAGIEVIESTSTPVL